MRDINSCTPLLRAAESGNNAVVKYLLTEGANIEAVNRLGHNCLHVAASRNHVDVMLTLVNCRGPIHRIINAGDNDSITPLHTAVGCGHKKMVELLMTHPRCDPKIEVDSFGTALDMALSCRQKEVANFLIKKDVPATRIMEPLVEKYDATIHKPTLNKASTRDKELKLRDNLNSNDDITRPKTSKQQITRSLSEPNTESTSQAISGQSKIYSNPPIQKTAWESKHQISRRPLPGVGQNDFDNNFTKNVVQFERDRQNSVGIDVMLRFDLANIKEELTNQYQDQFQRFRTEVQTEMRREHAVFLKRLEFIERKQQTCSCDPEATRQLSHEIDTLKKDIKSSSNHRQETLDMPQRPQTCLPKQRSLPSIPAADQSHLDTNGTLIYLTTAVLII